MTHCARSFLLLCISLAFPPALPAQEAPEDRTLHWREMVVDARLDADARLHVRERLAFVFDGDWNGGERGFDLRSGQRIQLNRVSRIDSRTGAAVPLVRGDLEEVDEYDWVNGELLRWRSRSPSDPPFEDREIVYELDYAIWPVLVASNSGNYLLSHDFAFAERVGVIERFHVTLTLDPVWAGTSAGLIAEQASPLPIGRGYTISRTLRHTPAGEPAYVVPGAPAWVRAAAVAVALLVPLLVFLGLRRAQSALDRTAPRTAHEEIDEAWLQEHIFRYPAELVGTAWDRSVGEAEVAALLARLVGEGKLESRVDGDEDDEPVLHLRRLVPLGTLEEHERSLLEALFYDGGERTDTASIREHYKEEGFDPASKVAPALTSQLKTLPGGGSTRRRWRGPLALIFLGAMTTILAGRSGGLPIGVLGLVSACVMGGIAAGFAGMLSRRMDGRVGPTVGVILPLTAAAVVLVLLALGVFESDFVRPGLALFAGLAMVVAGFGWLAVSLSATTETAVRLALRRRLVSARDFFSRELKQREPSLQDAWFPYLIAFGLGPHIDRWWRTTAGEADSQRTTTGSFAGSGSSGGTGWSGGGPQFGGGGGFGGGGAGRAWGVAASGMASGVGAASSDAGGGGGGGGGGGSSSGGGSGGGW